MMSAPDRRYPPAIDATTPGGPALDPRPVRGAMSISSRRSVLGRTRTWPVDGRTQQPFRTEGEAREYAEDRSKDFRVLAASVTQFSIGVLGARYALAWYLDGVEQPHRKSRPGRLYPSDGYHAN
jgi:hypothetical protein